MNDLSGKYHLWQRFVYSNEHHCGGLDTSASKARDRQDAAAGGSAGDCRCYEQAIAIMACGSYSRLMKLSLALFVGCVTATSLTAHPHVFVETGLELIVDGTGQLTHVRVIWEYDALYSLLITEDRSLDPDGDGLLTAAEIASLKGFDMQWSEGFNGDLVIADEARLVTLSGPQEVAISFIDGRIKTTHLRALKTPVSPGKAATIKAYDPTYYTAYEVSGPITVTGQSDCTVQLKAPEQMSGLAAIQQQLAKLEPQMDPFDAGLPEIGVLMASSVTVTCNGS